VDADVKESVSLDVPSMSERWLAAVPLLLGLLIIAYVASRVPSLIEPLKALRIDLPLPTRLAFIVGTFINDNYFVAMPTMLALCWLHFGWASKKRASMMLINQFWFLFFLIVLIIFVFGPIAPLVYIDMALRKK